LEAQGRIVRLVTDIEKIPLDEDSSVLDFGIFHIQIPESECCEWEILEYELVSQLIQFNRIKTNLR
jgi:hypothetical protein